MCNKVASCLCVCVMVCVLSLCCVCLFSMYVDSLCMCCPVLSMALPVLRWHFLPLGSPNTDGGMTLFVPLDTASVRAALPSLSAAPMRGNAEPETDRPRGHCWLLGGERAAFFSPLGLIHFASASVPPLNVSHPHLAIAGLGKTYCTLFFWLGRASCASSGQTQLEFVCMWGFFQNTRVLFSKAAACQCWFRLVSQSTPPL